MQLAMGTIFPEADSTCYKDVSKMYFGSTGYQYYDRSVPTIPDAVHTDLYDGGGKDAIPFDKLVEFLRSI